LALAAQECDLEDFWGWKIVEQVALVAYREAAKRMDVWPQLAGECNII